MPNNDYWKKRMESIEQMSHEKAMAYTSHIDKQFRIAETRINKQINYWYGVIADNNEVSFSAAKEMLRADELEDFHMTVEEYIKKGEALDFDSRYLQQLKNASAKVHIRRLEALQLQMQQECEVLYGNMTDGLDKTLADIYTASYYNTAYEFMKGHGVGWSFNKLDTRKIEKAVNTAWAYDNKTFKARCWENRNKLVNELNTTLTQSIIRGESPQRAIDQLSKRMKVSRYSAGRLIMTESCAISTMAQKGCYKELGVEKFEFVATLDNSTSDTCRAMDGKVFDMTDYKVGVNVPPLHCFCRSCTVPYYEDDFGSIGERAARGEDGKNYYVPADMTYEDWKKSFVKDDKTDSQETAADKYAGMSFMDKKEKIYTNEQEIERLYEQKKNAELQMLTGSSLADIEDAQKQAIVVSSHISELKTENESLQQSLGLPTNAKERFHSQDTDYSKLPCDVQESELGAVGSWTRTDYTFINQYLRNNDKGVRTESIQNAEILKRMIDRNVVTEPFTVKRGTDFNAMNHLFGSDVWKKEGYNVNGKVITDLGFFATTPDLHGGFGGGIQMYIDVPKGAKGVYLGDLSDAPNEKEFLIQCGTEFIVDKIEIHYDKIWGDPLYDVYMKVKVK